MQRIPLSAAWKPPVAWTLVDDEDYARFGHLNWTRKDRERGYAYRQPGLTERVYLHRAILGLTRDDPRTVDHINGDTLDNRRSNLRICTLAENLQNQGSLPGSSSPFRNVKWHKPTQRWMVECTVAGIRHYVGIFRDELDAARAAQAFRDEYMPFAQPDPALAQALERKTAA